MAWDAIVVHGIHHRGQLTLMCRLAGGQAPGLYGPNREHISLPVDFKSGRAVMDLVP